MSSKDFDENELMKDIDELNNTEIIGENAGKAAETKVSDNSALTENPVSETDGAEKPKKTKKVFTTKQVVLLVVVTVLAVLAIGTAVICSVANVNPVSYIAAKLTKINLLTNGRAKPHPGFQRMNFLTTEHTLHIYPPILLMANMK